MMRDAMETAQRAAYEAVWNGGYIAALNGDDPSSNPYLSTPNEVTVSEDNE